MLFYAIAIFLILQELFIPKDRRNWSKKMKWVGIVLAIGVQCDVGFALYLRHIGAHF